MERWKRVVASGLVVVVGIPLLFVGTLYAVAWCQRWRAERLLAVVRTIRPGVTTQAEYMDAMNPPDSNPMDMFQNDAVKGSMLIANEPRWIYEGIARGGAGFQKLVSQLDGILVVPVTGLIVRPKFQDGMVASIYLMEIRGACTRRCGANVVYEARRFATQHDDLNTFSGYSASLQNETDEGTFWDVEVRMDERASAEQVSRALDFRFICFTDFHRCGDARNFLQPLPEALSSGATR